MTYHSNVNYECNSCKQPYIPFKEEIACPRCNTTAEETIPIVDEVLEFLKNYGFKTPEVWGIFSLGDTYILTAAQAISSMPEQANPREFARNFAKKLTPKHRYLEDHIAGFLEEVLTKVGEK